MSDLIDEKKIVEAMHRCFSDRDGGRVCHGCPFESIYESENQDLICEELVLMGTVELLDQVIAERNDLLHQLEQKEAVIAHQCKQLKDAIALGMKIEKE